MPRLPDQCISPVRDNLLVAVTLSYVTGAVLAHYWQIHPYTRIFLFSALIVSGLCLLAFRHHRRAVVLLLPFFLLIGLLHTAAGFRPPDDPRHLYNLLPEQKKVTLTGRILNMPEYDGEKTRFDLDADTILFHAERADQAVQEPAKGKIRLSVEDEIPMEIQPGDQVMVLATAGRTFNYRTPGVFNYKLYLAERDIHVTGKIQSALDIIPFHDVPPSRWDRARFLPERWRHDIGSFLTAALTPETAGIYQALLIGSRAGISETTLEGFKASGCMHLLAISGIHMSLLGLMIIFTLTWFMKRSSWLLLHTHVPTVATVLALLPLTVYAFIAGLNTPVLRSLLMSCLFLIGVVLQRQRSLFVVVAAAALLLLVWKPLALFTASFQLSFGAILAIAILYPRLRRQFEPDSPSAGNRLRTYLSSAFLVSIAASLGALPFMLLHFNRFSLIGPVLNLLVEPFLCLWALPLGLLAIPLIPVAPAAATLLLKCGSIGIVAAERITMLGSAIPFGSVRTITPSAPLFVFYYLLLFLWFARSWSPRTRKILLVSTFLLLYMFVRGIWFPLSPPGMEVVFLDVGQGSSTLIRLPNGRAVLVDGGGNTSPSFDIGERVIAPFLRHAGLWRIDDVILTHPHSDHVNGIDFILRHFRPKRLWINGKEKDSRPYRTILHLAEKSGATIIEPGSDMRVELSPGTSLTFVQGADTESRPGISVNDLSLVLRLDYGDASFLFPGDIGKSRETGLINKGADLEADVLLAPHHGSRGSGSGEFISQVDPEIIVISAGRNSRKKYIDTQHLSTWLAAGRTVLITADSGTITCRTAGNDIQIETYVGNP